VVANLYCLIWKPTYNCNTFCFYCLICLLSFCALSFLVIAHLLYVRYHLALHKYNTIYDEMTTLAPNPTYSSVTSQNTRPDNPYRYDRQVEVQVKFATPAQRYEIYEELWKLQFNFQSKLLAVIQLPGLRAPFHARSRDAAIELKEKLTLSQSQRSLKIRRKWTKNYYEPRTTTI